MALLTGISSITKGTIATVTLSKSDLLAIPDIASNPDFSADKIKEVKVVYMSARQRKELVFDFSQASPTDTILFSVRSHDLFDIDSITVFDVNAGHLKVSQAQIPSLTINLSSGSGGSGGGSGGGGSGASVFLDMEGSSIVDQGSMALPVTLNGAALSTEQAKHGSQSLKFSNLTDVAKFGPIQFGSQDFTIEGWFYFPTSLSSQQTGTPNLFSVYSSSQTPSAPAFDGFVVYHQDYWNGVTLLFATPYSYNMLVKSNYYMPVQQWVHFALVRNGASFAMYFDGIKHGDSQTDYTPFGKLDASFSLNTQVDPMTIGTGQFGPANFSPQMYVDDFKVTLGTAKYTSNFTPS